MRPILSRRPLLTLFILRLLSLPTCNGYVNWLYPNDGLGGGSLTYNYNDEVYFTWQSNYTDPGLYLYCVDASRNVYIETNEVVPVPANGTNRQSFPYPDYYNSTCHMGIRCQHNECTAGIYGPDFTVGYVPAQPPQTWGAAVALAATASPTASTTSTSATITSSPSAVETPTLSPSPAEVTSIASEPQVSTSKGLSTGAKAGIGVGAALGALAFLAGIFIVWRMRRSRRGGMGAMNTMTESKRNELDTTTPLKKYEMDTTAPSSELDGRARSELP